MEVGNVMKKFPTHEEGGVKHWAAEEASCDTQIACDLMPMEDDLQDIDCVDCLKMIIFHLTPNKQKRSDKADGLL
jgi:nitrate/TMAO reductase-like tetraheme cytochrome c subunit